MTRHAESTKARKNHIVPMTDIRPKAINAFLDSQKIPEMQLNILKDAPTGAWRTAAKQSGEEGSYTTGLSPEKAVPHYHLGKAAMFILKHGAEKVVEMPSKIKEAQSRQTAKALYNPLDMFSDRRKN